MKGQIPSRGGVEWFGDPLDDEGAYIVSHSETRPLELYRELMLVTALKNGAEDTVDLRLEIEMRAGEEERRVLAMTRTRGVSVNLRALLAAKRKKDVEQIGRDMVLGHPEFYDLLQNSRLLGLSKYSTHYCWLPEGRSLSADEREELFESGPSDPRLVGKVRQGFEEREHRSVHMLTNPSGDRWHCFYLTFKDVGGAPSTGTHHWRGGAHVHFVNCLSNPQKLTRRTVLKQLAEREHSINGLHIRFDVGRKKADTGERLYADPGTGRIAKIQIARPANGPT